jgi:ribosomal RNA small subunit methyltransferase A
MNRIQFVVVVLFLGVSGLNSSNTVAAFVPSPRPTTTTNTIGTPPCFGWKQRSDGEWEWQEDDPSYRTVAASAQPTMKVVEASATPQLPSGTYKPKQSLGQNYLRDGNTVAKIIRAFHKDATLDDSRPIQDIVELGPGAGALTDKLIETYGTQTLQCIEIDDRSVQILQEKHPTLRIRHDDVLQVDYRAIAQQVGQPLVVIGNLPYYITSQILFALADASHFGAVSTATVTMQWEVGQRMVAPICTKDYGILSVVFQLYADVNCHFKIPPTVFYPKPKVDSA